MSLNAFTGHRLSDRAYHGRKFNSWLPRASAFRRATDVCAVPPLDIGIQAIQLWPYRSGVAERLPTRLWSFSALTTGAGPLALSGPGKLFASESSALNSGHLGWQFLLCVTRRTVSAHPAFHRNVHFLPSGPCFLAVPLYAGMTRWAEATEVFTQVSWSARFATLQRDNVMNVCGPSLNGATATFTRIPGFTQYGTANHLPLRPIFISDFERILFEFCQVLVESSQGF